MKSLILTATTAIVFLVIPFHQANAFNITISEQNFHGRAEVFYNSGNYSAAWAVYDQGVKKNPKSFICFAMRGVCSAKMGFYNAAIDDYTASLRFAKDNEERGWTHYELAMVYVELNEEQKAIEHIVASAKLGNGLAQMICKQNNELY